MDLFPSKHYAECAEYTDDYFTLFAQAAASVDRAQMGRAATLLQEAIATNNAIFSCGNGGSAAIANHLTCDCLKGIRNGTTIKPNVYSLASTTELITAIANDMSYEDIFSFQLESHAKSGDLLIVISSSGSSPNIIKALRLAKALGMRSIAMTGFSGGPANDLADVPLWVNATNYGIVEDVHQSLMHILAQHTRQLHVDQNTLGFTKF